MTDWQPGLYGPSGQRSTTPRPATYVSHEGSRPMAVTWRLHHRLSGDLFEAFAAAAG
jgi:hypothetical protein